MQMNVYGGTQNSLMFPVMCDAYINVDYAKNIADENTGIWDLKGSFTVEMIVTPYDVNGWGSNSVNNVNESRGKQSSLKTMPATADSLANPANQQDIDYLPVAYQGRSKHKMNLFYNENLEIALKNTTTHNQNNPAEYSLLVNMKINGTNQTLESPVVVASRDRHYRAETDYLAYLYDSSGAVYAKETMWQAASSTSSTITMLTLNNPQNSLYVGQELWTDDGTSLGAITAIDTGTRVLTMSNIDLPSLSSGTVIWIGVNKEAPYLESTYHFAVSFDNSTNMIYLFCNGQEVTSTPHLTPGDFVFGASNIYIGQNPTAGTPASDVRDLRNTQFMGEYHELAVTEGYQNKFNSLYTLTPAFRDTLLYLDFEEVDE